MAIIGRKEPVVLCHYVTPNGNLVTLYASATRGEWFTTCAMQDGTTTRALITNKRRAREHYDMALKSDAGAVFARFR